MTDTPKAPAILDQPVPDLPARPFEVGKVVERAPERLGHRTADGRTIPATRPQSTYWRRGHRPRS